MAQTKESLPSIHSVASYMVNLAAQGSAGNEGGCLCLNCSRIELEDHFLAYEPSEFVERDEYIFLGSLTQLVNRSDCPFCQLVVLTVMAQFQRRLGTKLTAEQLTSDAKAVRLIRADWYMSPCPPSVEKTAYPRSFQLFLRPNIYDDECTDQTAISQMDYTWPFALRIIADRNRGGRRIPADHLDFSWIKRTFELCDISTEMPPRNFSSPLRAIDTQNMCIVALPEGAPYVALSYAWGRIKSTKLTSGNENRLRKPGALSSFPDIPLAVKDAIELTRKVGQHYLWVDGLCIVQDDVSDLQEQMSQMGTLYMHSYFTIFAISGDDANYGLPGVRPGSRNLNQYVRRVGNLAIANSLPWMEDEDLNVSGAWGTRAWTLQERFRSQRGLFVGDHGMIINCLHTYSSEDEHCFHTDYRNEHLLAKGTTFFYSGLDKRCQMYQSNRNTAFDTFALLVSEYTQRNMTYQLDALNAFSGISETIANKTGWPLIHGLPEAEFDAAFLWSPVGSSIRRCDPATEAPLFPSWSWLGWVGHAAYPWTLERDTFMTTLTSPLEWHNACPPTPPIDEESAMDSDEDIDDLVHQRRNGSLKQPSPSVERLGNLRWFVSEDVCLPLSPHRYWMLNNARNLSADHLGIRLMGKEREYSLDPPVDYEIQWPHDFQAPWKYAVLESNRICFRTIVAELYVVGRPFTRNRTYNIRHNIQRLSIVDENAHLVGYIDIPDPASRQIRLGPRLFAILSRSTTDGQWEPEPDNILRMWRDKADDCPTTYLPWDGGMETQSEIQKYEHKTELRDIHPTCNFDVKHFRQWLPWCMLNVMMLDELDKGPGSETAYTRDTIGRIHVDAVRRWSCFSRDMIVNLE